MNTVFKAAAATVQGGWLMGGMTAFFLFFFLAWAWWAWRPSARALMAAAAAMPLDDETEGTR